MITELLPALPLLLQSPFSSHPIRVLLLLLAGRPIPSATDSGASAVRSKRSEKYAQQNANFKPVVENAGETDEQAKEALRVPAALRAELAKFWRTVRFEISPVESRALGVGNVSGPVLQMLIELEAAGGEADEDGSLLDSCLCGLVAASRTGDAPKPERQDYVEHLLRDQAGSHLLEALLLHSPPRIFDLLWSTYFTGRLGKLGVHPVGNYVVAKGVRRLDGDQLGRLLDENADWGRAVKRSRLGVISAVVNRSAELGVHGQAVLTVRLARFLLHPHTFVANGLLQPHLRQAVCSAFEIKGKEQEGYLVPCLLSLKPRRVRPKSLGADRL
jgi:nucleolar protein 9